MLNRRPIPSSAERRIRRERALALRQAGWTYAAIGEALGVSPTRAHQIVKKTERLVRDPRWYDVLPARAQHFLWSRGWLEFDELEVAQAAAQLSRRELMRTPDLGPTTCKAIIAWLAIHGFKLQPESAYAFRLRLGREAKERVAELRQLYGVDDVSG